MQRRDLIDHGYTLVGFLPVERGDVDTVQEAGCSKESVSLHGLSSANVVPLEKSHCAHIFSERAQRTYGSARPSKAI